jgi:cytochrome c553
MKSILYGVSILLAVSCGSAIAAGNVKAGKTKAEACISCHGEDGNANVPIFPKLAGQHQSYLIKQLREFRSQTRVEPTMNAMAGGLSDADIDDIAAYFASFKVRYETAEPTVLGEKVYRTGNSETKLTACTGCHGPRGAGNPLSAYPHLAGQYSEFISKALNDYKNGERNNDPNAIMRTIAARMSAEEINAVADYIASLK